MAGSRPARPGEGERGGPRSDQVAAGTAGHTRHVDRLPPADLDGHAEEIEALVEQTPGADRWCSTLDWVLPAHLAFAPHAEPLLLHDVATVALLARYESVDGVPLIAGLEPLWGFACPLLGPQPGPSSRRLASALASDPDWEVLVLTGVSPQPEVLRPVMQALAALGPVRLMEGITRQVADLSDGLASYWERRGSRFRRNVRRAQREAERRGLRIEDAAPDADLHHRLVRIEERSWKGRAGDGLVSPTMSEFYRLQVDRLGRQGRIRALVAVLDGQDVGFILGGRRHTLYRGLQLSFAEEVRALSVGHLLQAAELERLAGTGVTTYDLGMDLDYKRSWADRAVTTVTVVVRRAPNR